MIALCHNVGMNEYLNDLNLARMDEHAPEDDAQKKYDDRYYQMHEDYIVSLWRKAFPSMDEASIQANVRLYYDGDETALKFINLEQNRKG